MKTQQWYESQRLKTQTKEEVEAELRKILGPTATDPTYKPRRWTGEYIDTNHWWWIRSTSQWLRCISGLGSCNDIFLRPDAPKPTEPPGDDIEDCAVVDWLDELPTVTDRLDALEERVSELEKA